VAAPSPGLASSTLLGGTDSKAAAPQAEPQQKGSPQPKDEPQAAPAKAP
jgi:hypothetical protein